MAPSIDTAASQWLQQLADMRRAIADLNLPKESSGPIYGQDLNINEQDSSVYPADDLWDLIEDDEDYEVDEELGRGETEASWSHRSGHQSNGIHQEPGAAIEYDRSWLIATCDLIEQGNGGATGSKLYEQVLEALKSPSTDENLQVLLVDILGLDAFDTIAAILSNRQSLVREPDQPAATHHKIGKTLNKSQREEQLRKQDRDHKNAELRRSVDRTGTSYPHVYRSHDAGNLLNASGAKYALPIGSVRTEHDLYEEFTVPAAKVGTLGAGRSLVDIASMDGLCQRTFKGYKSLNRMQSLLYPVAYKTQENMLICAPTGAGKTDAAMLTILNTIGKNLKPNPLEAPDAKDFEAEVHAFKIVYVAPMKALAAEVTEKLSKRLSWLGIQARELTGDMQLTKAEINATQIIVTTPEKWDVVTRKSTGDTALVQKVRLLIIDEVHMLHDERGAVLESLVARTLRQVESTQSLIRIVGLSATLPNFIDVSDFLKVNRMAGLFYFDASFRPVPLEQHFVGVKNNKGSLAKARENLDAVAYEKVKDMLEKGHQVMVFVHSRKDTVKTARTLYQKFMEEGLTHLLDTSDNPMHDQSARDLKSTKTRDLRELVPKALGVHHAGLPRTDRNLIERLFTQGVLRVLCCTATLAWGVNLPAACVIIKGTQLYSAEEGKFVDLGILDVLQIFGRAGRPQFQDTGIGYILTKQASLDHYLSAVTQQQPIESRFSRKLVDNLNAEIGLGTVTSVEEGVQWLGYSYLFVRMQRQPRQYGIEWAEIRDDPQLVQRRRKLIIAAALELQKSQMIIFNETTEDFRSKDVGRIASQFYVQQSSIDIFNRHLKPMATEADVFKVISMSKEFSNIQARESEEKELSNLRGDGNIVPCDIENEVGSPHGKTNILLQAYISKARLEDFTLSSDMAYVAQNSARICRALFMIVLNRRWGHLALVLLSLCKSIEKQMWPYDHPFHQFDLPVPVLQNLDKKKPSSNIESMRDMDAPELGSLVHNHKMGRVLTKLLDNFPTLTVEAEIAPINRDILRIRLYLTPDFRWNERHHGFAESYWIWVENSETSEIYHHEYFLLTKKKLDDEHQMDFTIPMSDPMPAQIYVRAVSDRWLGAETVTAVSFQHLIRPDTESYYTDLLDLQPLPITALQNVALEENYGQKFKFFNPMQTQCFHTLYHSSTNVLLGSPTGSGKTIACELAMWQSFRDNPGSKVVYIAPMKALVRERVKDWGARLTKPMGLKLVELTGDSSPDTRAIRNADIIITVPEKWDSISRSWQARDYVRKVSLVIMDEIHLLGGDRGPVLEIIVSRMNYIASQSEKKIRLMGMSTACANAKDLGSWLGVKQGLFNFRPSIRPVPMEVYIEGFPEQRGFCPLMQSMNRPTFLAIKQHSPTKPVIVFVSSRRQTRLTADDLINFCGMEDNPRRFLRMSEDDLAMNLTRAKDDALCKSLTFGIALHHAGLVESDRQLAEELFANNKVQILVATSTLAWGVNLPAHLVVVKGTQFYDAKVEGYRDMDLTDVLQMLGRAGRPQFDTSGIARIFTQDAKKEFYKHFLHTGFPVESSLHKVLDDHLGAEIAAETIKTKQDALDYLTWTFFYRRLHKNPSYYGLELSAEAHNTQGAQIIANDYMVDLVDKTIEELEESGCVEMGPEESVLPTPFGKYMSYYYISHKTVRFLREHAHNKATFQDVLSWICHATEYDELPVRHNEDDINIRMSEKLPFDGNVMGLPMWDPHVKAFVLLQAHFSRMHLPITDYIGDTNSVLDQSIRIIQASIDILAELGHLNSVKMMITLLQCVKSARWPQDDPLTIFTNKLPTSSSSSSSNNNNPSTLLQLTKMTKPQLKQFSNRVGLPATEADHMYHNLSRLPQLALSQEDARPGRLAFDLRRTNPIMNHQQHMYAPRFPKPQTEGFFAIASDAATGELCALKRVSWPTNALSGPGPGPRASEKGAGNGNSQRQSLSLKVAMSIAESEMEGDGERRLKVEVMSDGYMGLDWELPGGGVTLPARPKVPFAEVEKSV